MGRILVESSQSSSATHRITQPSTTHNRRSLRRPTNLVIEEAARISSEKSEPATPSRLVNLRVSNTDLEAAKAAEAARRELLQTERIYQVAEFGGNQGKISGDSVNDRETAQPPVEVISVESAETSISEPTRVASEAIDDSAEIVGNAEAEPAENGVDEITEVAGAEPAVEAIDTAALKASIATDFATASMGAIANEMGANFNLNPVAPDPSAIPQPTPADDIAQAAAEAIASIRIATEPSQVSEQLSSLRNFADNIKSSQNSAEMRELGDTIEKFINVAMKSTAVQAETAATKSSVPLTLAPKVARAANKVEKVSAKAIAVQNRTSAQRTARPNAAMTKNVSARARRNVQRNTLRPRPHKSVNNPDELKDQAIERALNSIATMNEKGSRSAGSAKSNNIIPRRRLRPRHAIIALSCAAACVGAILYFVSTNIPDISVQVAAMQTGIQASYPSYVPRDYSLGNVLAEDGKIVMKFTAKDESYFTITEEKSSWDSAALLRNFVEPAWQDNYTTTHEQGITIYINNTSSDAAWMNGGVLYKITSSGNVLTKKQVRNIVVSL